MNKALIIGYTGQDGIYLWKLLNYKNYEIIGVSSKNVFSADKGYLENVDIRNFDQVSKLVKDFQPDELYYLAAVHQSSSDKQMQEGELFQKSIDINSKSLVNFLEAIRLYSGHTKLFYAASSHVFGETTTEIQDETTPLNPNCIYGITKTMGIRACHYYLENHNIFASDVFLKIIQDFLYLKYYFPF